MASDDSVIEPGESGYISQVTVTNDGQMPTPLYSDFFIRCSDNQFVKCLNDSPLPRGILPGQHQVEVKSEFEI